MTGLFDMQENDLVVAFAMRNDPVVLATGVGGLPMSWHEHEALFKYAKYPKYVYKVDNKVIGYVEFRPYPKSEDPSVTEWGFHIAPWARSQGHSKKMLIEALMRSKDLFHTIIGRVKPTNEKSIALHEKLGFSLQPTDPKDFMLEYIKTSL